MVESRSATLVTRCLDRRRRRRRNPYPAACSLAESRPQDPVLEWMGVLYPSLEFARGTATSARINSAVLACGSRAQVNHSQPLGRCDRRGFKK